MRYAFETMDGEVITLDMSMHDAPGFGEVIEHEGRKLTRIASLPQVCGAHAGSTRSPRFESHQEPRYIRGNKASEEYWKGHKGGFNPKNGKPRFETKEQVDSHVARKRWAGHEEAAHGEL